MTFGNRFVAGRCANIVFSVAERLPPIVRRTIGFPDASLTTARAVDESRSNIPGTTINIPAPLVDFAMAFPS